MEHKLKPTSRDSQFLGLSSYPVDKPLVLETGAQPKVVNESLPERYDMQLFELLVVDPFYVFVSWEVTGQQLDELEAKWGRELYAQRRLVVRFNDADNGRFIHSLELYGDTGRWFVSLGESDRWIRAELNFVSDLRTFTVASAGPVFVPRTKPVEPLEFIEMSVVYSTGAKGQLVIRDRDRTEKDVPSCLKLAATEFSIERREQDGQPDASGLRVAGHSWPFGPSSGFEVGGASHTKPGDTRGKEND